MFWTVVLVLVVALVSALLVVVAGCVVAVVGSLVVVTTSWMIAPSPKTRSFSSRQLAKGAIPATPPMLPTPEIPCGPQFRHTLVKVAGSAD